LLEEDPARRPSLAVILDYAQYLAPAGDLGGLARAQSTNLVSEKVSGLANAAGETGQSAQMVRDHAGELARQAEALRGQVDQFLSRIRAA